MGKPTLVALVGMQHRGTADFVKGLPDGEPLTLIREPTNRFDRFAVQVWARDTHVGYVKGTQVRPIAMAMDSALGNPHGTPAKLSTRNGERWPMVELEI